MAIFNWNTAFEGSPSGSDYGSVSGHALRSVKSAFVDLLSVEHSVDLGADATVSHALGKSSVLGPADAESTTFVAGGVVLDSNVLVAFDGSSKVYFGDHNQLSNISATDHPQYLARSPMTIKGAVTAESINSLPDTLQEFTVEPHFVLSRGGHPEDSSPSHGTLPEEKLSVGLGNMSVESEWNSVTLHGDASATHYRYYSQGFLVYNLAPYYAIQPVTCYGDYTLSFYAGSYFAEVGYPGEDSLRLYPVFPQGTGNSNYQTNVQFAYKIAEDYPDREENWNIEMLGIS